LAPLAIGLLIEPLARGVVAVTASLSLSALIAMLLLQARSRTADVPTPAE
jgi:hypothetical protein